MTATQRFIEDAVKGGGFGNFKNPQDVTVLVDVDFIILRLGEKEIMLSLYKVLLLPEVWEAVSFVRNWGRPRHACGECGRADDESWKSHQIDFVQTFVQGKDIESALQAIENV